MNTADILVLFYSRYGATRDLARLIAEGIESVPGASARLRCVPAVSSVCEATEPAVPADGAPYAEYRDLEDIDAVYKEYKNVLGNLNIH